MHSQMTHHPSSFLPHDLLLISPHAPQNALQTLKLTTTTTTTTLDLLADRRRGGGVIT